MSVINASMCATQKSIPSKNIGTDKHKHLPGWNEEHDLACEQSLFWNSIWVSCERPGEGHVANGMRFTRSRYHRLIRRIKNDRDSAVRR